MLTSEETKKINKEGYRVYHCGACKIDLITIFGSVSFKENEQLADKVKSENIKDLIKKKKLSIVISGEYTECPQCGAVLAQNGCTIFPPLRNHS